MLHQQNFRWLCKRNLSNINIKCCFRASPSNSVSLKVFSDVVQNFLAQSTNAESRAQTRFEGGPCSLCKPPQSDRSVKTPIKMELEQLLRFANVTLVISIAIKEWMHLITFCFHTSTLSDPSWPCFLSLYGLNQLHSAPAMWPSFSLFHCPGIPSGIDHLHMAAKDKA